MANVANEGMEYLETLPRRLVTVYLPLGMMLFLLLFPFYWMATTTFKPDAELYDYEHSTRSGSFTQRSSTSTNCCLRRAIPTG